mmetsp:Transcript_41893/g.129501  ORF Transcript_41893/g.129501 Transcript_41893/m.129501 type:complete len:125 (-) Transcript_41893:157-531(-)
MHRPILVSALVRGGNAHPPPPSRHTSTPLLFFSSATCNPPRPDREVSACLLANFSSTSPGASCVSCLSFSSESSMLADPQQLKVWWGDAMRETSRFRPRPVDPTLSGRHEERHSTHSRAAAANI